MDSLIQTFHIDWRLLLAQMVNFAIVFSVLYWLVLKPLFATLNERNKKIESGLQKAEQAQLAMEEAQRQAAELVKAGRREAAELLRSAKEQAERKRSEMLDEARAEIGRVINQEKAAMQQEKAAVLSEIKREVAELVKLSLVKLLPELADSKIDDQLIKRSKKK